MINPVLWSPGVTLAQIEKQIILKAFAFYKGSKITTAQALGISVRTLDHKFERYRKEDGDAEKRADELRIKREDFLLRSRGQHPSQKPAQLPLASAKPKAKSEAKQGDGIQSASNT